jgi:hypothetical protein
MTAIYLLSPSEENVYMPHIQAAALMALLPETKTPPPQSTLNTAN